MSGRIPALCASIPTCAAVVSAALLAGCSDPYERLPMRPAGYWGATQLLEERVTGCLYVVNSKNRETEAPKPMLRPDGSHMGCKPTTARAVGMSPKGE